MGIGVGGLELTRGETIQRNACSFVLRLCGWSLRSGWRWTPFYFAYQAAECRIITLNYAPMFRWQEDAIQTLRNAERS